VNQAEEKESGACVDCKRVEWRPFELYEILKARQFQREICPELHEEPKTASTTKNTSNAEY